MNKKANSSLLIFLLIGGLVFFIIQGNSSDSNNTPSQTVDMASGIEVYITDAPGDVEYMDVNINKIDLIGKAGTRTILSSMTQVRLQEKLVQKVAGELIPKGEYTQLKIYFNNAATARLKDGSSKQVETKDGVIVMNINKEVSDDEIITLVVDVPLADSLTEEGEELIFEPKNMMIQSQVRTQERTQLTAQLKEKINVREQIMENNNIDSINQRYGKV